MAHGWFADLDDEGEYWRPYLQLEGMCLPLDGIWFHSKEQCDEFIVTEVVGKPII